MLAQVDSTNSITESNVSNNVVVSPNPVVIGPPFVDLSPSFPTPASGSPPVIVTPGSTGSELVTVTNNGNIAAQGNLTIVLSATGGPSNTTTSLLPAFVRRVTLGAGASRRSAYLPRAQAGPGDYHYAALVDPGNIFNDVDRSNNIASDPTPSTVQ